MDKSWPAFWSVLRGLGAKVELNTDKQEEFDIKALFPMLDKSKTYLIVGLGLLGGKYAQVLSQKGYHDRHHPQPVNAGLCLAA